MKNKLKNLYYSIRYSNFISKMIYSRETHIKVLSTVAFAVLFFSICGIFELVYPRTMQGQINNLIDKLFWLGVK